MRTSHKAGLLATLGLTIAGFGCAYKTQELISDLTPKKVTERDTPYSIKEIVYGEGNRVYVKELQANQTIKVHENGRTLEGYLPISLVPLKGSKEIVNPSERKVTVEGENYPLFSLGKKTLEIQGREGEFQDYFNLQKGLNKRKAGDIPFKLPTIKIKGNEFYKIRATDNETNTLPLYLVDVKGAEIIFNREKGRIEVRGITYQPTKADIVEKIKPRIEVREVAGKLIGEPKPEEKKPEPSPQQEAKLQTKPSLEAFVADFVPSTPKAQKGLDDLKNDQKTNQDISYIINSLSEGNKVQAKEKLRDVIDRGYQEKAIEEALHKEMKDKKEILERLGIEAKN